MKSPFAIALALFAFFTLGKLHAQTECQFELSCPSDAVVSCGDDISPETLGVPSVITSCPDLVTGVVHTDLAEGDACLTVITRTFMLMVDEEEVASCSQTIVVEDNTPPAFPDLPDDIVIACGEELPEPPACPAVDECSEVLSCETFVAQTGSPVDSCVLTLPYGPGPDWSVWLPGLNLNNPYFYWDSQGTMITYFNGTARITGTVRNYADSSIAFELDMWLQNARNWDEWSALGRYYKDDYNLAGDDYLDWTYYEMVDAFSTLTGIDGAEGSMLYLYHMPVDYFFGFQCGVAANNHNANEGISGWFTFEGTYNGEAVQGDGDLASDKACENISSPECVSNAGFTYYWRATDACGNVGLASQSVASQDNTAPYFLNFPEDVTLNCTELEDNPAAPDAADDCPGAVTVEGPYDVITPGECPIAFIIERTWVAMDACGNTLAQTQMISVIDEVGPSFTDVPELVELSCSADVATVYAEAFDDCTEPIITYEDVPLGEGCEGSVFRTYTVSDACGNSASATQTILVNDTETPVFTSFPNDLNVDCGEIPAADDPSVQYSDNCPDLAVDIEELITPGDCPGSYSVIRTYTLTDGCGNTATATWTIDVSDEEAPQLLGVPQDISLGCGDPIPDALVFAVDNCDEAPVVSLTATTEQLDCGYLFIRTWTAVDQCGNTSEQTQTITVTDDEAPVFISVPEDLTLECTDEVPFSGAAAEDECSSVSVEMMETVETNECTITITRTFTAADGCGNEAVHVQTISVVDTSAPLFDFFPVEITVDCGALESVPTPTASDNCSQEVSITYSDEYLSNECPVTINRAWTVTDGCGNSATFGQIIYLVDETAPEFVVLPENMTVECDEVPDWDDFEVLVFDNCSEPSLEVFDETLPGDCPSAFILSRTYVLTDECGNQSTATRTITVQDTQEPQLLGVPQDITLNCTDPVPDAIVFAIDNCDDELEVSLTATTEELECGYQFIRTWSTVDDCGNVAEATQIITFEDNTDPVLSFFPEDIYLSCGDPIPPIAEVEVIDECDPDAFLVVTDEVEGGPCPQTIVRVFRGFDCAGNYAIYAQYIYFEEPPGSGLAEEERPDVLVQFNNSDAENYQIGLEAGRASHCRVELLDLSGRRVRNLAEPMLEAGSRMTIDLDTQGLTPGIYLVRVSTATWNEVYKIIVLR